MTKTTKYIQNIGGIISAILSFVSVISFPIHISLKFFLGAAFVLFWSQVIRYDEPPKESKIT